MLFILIVWFVLLFFNLKPYLQIKLHIFYS